MDTYIYVMFGALGVSIITVGIWFLLKRENGGS